MRKNCCATVCAPTRATPPLLYELGQLYFEGRHDPDQARNLYSWPLDNWGKENAGKDGARQISPRPHHQRARQTGATGGNTTKAIAYLKLLKRVSPSPDDDSKAD